jgi:hypothetical protein
MRTIALSVVLGLMTSGPMVGPASSEPQRDAVSSTLSPEAAAAVFDDAFPQQADEGRVVVHDLKRSVRTREGGDSNLSFENPFIR